MASRTKSGLFVLFFLFLLIGLSVILKGTSKTYTFDFAKSLTFEFKSDSLRKIVSRNLEGKQGTYAIYIEGLQSGEKYSFNESEILPAASLYKLILMAAILKKVEAGELELETTITGSKKHLIEVLGEEDFGYEGVPETITYTVDEALTRVGRISDNFAAIMLTDKLRQIRVSQGEDNKLLIQMTQDLGMVHTNFESDPIDTTAPDIGLYFLKLYRGGVVSEVVSEQIVKYLSLSNLNNRIPALLPKEVKVVHKTGELARVRHDAGFVVMPEQAEEGEPYIIVLMSKDLQYEDEAIETMSQISKEIYDHFSKKKAGSKEENSVK